MRYLDVVNTTLTQPIDPTGAKPGEARFVEVEVAEVVNPAHARLSFEVFFEPAGAARVGLGMFSLYPVDNPGAFIVPTQGQVDRAGMLVVALVVADPVPAGVPLKVGIARIALSSGLPRH